MPQIANNFLYCFFQGLTKTQFEYFTNAQAQAITPEQQAKLDSSQLDVLKKNHDVQDNRPSSGNKVVNFSSCVYLTVKA